MDLAFVCSKAMVLLFLIHWLNVLSLFGWVDVVIGSCYALLTSVVSCRWCSVSLPHGAACNCGIS